MYSFDSQTTNEYGCSHSTTKMLEADQHRKEQEARVVSERERTWKEDLRALVIQPHLLADSQQVAHVGE